MCVRGGLTEFAGELAVCCRDPGIGHSPLREKIHKRIQVLVGLVSGLYADGRNMSVFHENQLAIDNVRQSLVLSIVDSLEALGLPRFGEHDHGEHHTEFGLDERPLVSEIHALVPDVVQLLGRVLDVAMRGL